MAPPVALTIAGSDPSGGAGVQGDLKVFHQHGVYGAGAITLLTVQNTLGVTGTHVPAAGLVAAQVRAVLEDLPVGAVKTGALGSADTVAAVAACLADQPAPLIVDPVNVASRGGALLGAGGLDRMRTELLPLAALITPNLDEAEALLGRPVRSLDQMRAAARALVDLGAGAAWVKGGHLEGPPTDVLYVDGQLIEFAFERVLTTGTHGTGCALSAAVCARLCLGEGLRQACVGARAWLQVALAGAPDLGAGNGPIDSFAPVTDPSRAGRS